MFAIESNAGSPEMQLSASIEVSGVRHFLQVLELISINHLFRQKMINCYILSESIFFSLDNNMELAGMGEAADESESEVVGGGQGDKRQGQGDGQEGEPGRELGEKIVGTGKVGDGRLEDQEGVEGESPSSQAASSFPSMTSSR